MNPRGRSKALISGGLAVALAGVGIGLWNVTSSYRFKDAAAAVVTAAPGKDRADRSLGGLQERLRVAPKDWRAWAALGSAYVEEARLRVDPTYYPKAQGALDRSLRLAPTGNYQALAGLGALAAARHDFAGALRFGERALAINPYSAMTHGIVGDALIELGRYDEAYASFQRMVDLRPDLSSYARVSYTWELRGNTSNARKALDLALRVASSPSESAFATYYLGELSWNEGKLDAAESAYRRGLLLDASFLPNRAGVAKVEAARGQTSAAIDDYLEVVNRYPLPQFVGELGDLYEAAGKKKLALEQFALVHLQEKLLQANGVNIDIELALFGADHRSELRSGLEAARAEWSRRKSVFVADALAWQLYANGRPQEALTYSKQAMRLGTRNASFFYHRAMIESSLGNVAREKENLRTALGINPYFSIRWAGEAKRRLATLDRL